MRSASGVTDCGEDTPGVPRGAASSQPTVALRPRATVAVAMSGGVDSSSVAALLKHEGYQVIGLTMKLWTDQRLVLNAPGTSNVTPAIEDARRVARFLDIPHHVIDLEQEFRHCVVDYFSDEYFRGRTPNPCVVCNRNIKLGLLLSHAIELGADCLATGHYARVRYDSLSHRYILLKGIDLHKDQTYVLYRLTQDQLSRLVFPLGDYTKQEVRSIAERFRLPVATGEESQEICFIPDNDYRSFLRRYRQSCSQRGADRSNTRRRGLIVDTIGEVLGTHDGIEQFTIGQRKGLGLAFGERLYVVALDPANNSVVVGRDHDLYSSGLTACDCNFVSIAGICDGMRAQVKIRYSFSPVEAMVKVDGERPDCMRVVFDEPVRAVTPGQAVVLYSDDMLLGGGTIEHAFPCG